MKFEKSSPKLIEYFEKVAPGPKDGVEPRKMFGYPCRFVNGNMFTGLHENNLILRLPEEERNKFFLIKGTKPFMPMPGRIMKEYVVITEEMKEDEKLIKPWIKKSLKYVKTLPPKLKK